MCFAPTSGSMAAGPIYAFTTSESAIVPVRAVFWLDNTSWRRLRNEPATQAS
jgi:hypothetical protein